MRSAWGTGGARVVEGPAAGVGGGRGVAYAGIGREHEVERGRLAAGAAAVVEHVRHGRGADRPPGEGLGERGLQRGRADLIEQTQQARGLTGERGPPDGGGGGEGG